MTDNDKRRADTARANDDSELIEGMEEAPAHGGRSGGRIARDVGTQAEAGSQVDAQSVTRVRASDKKEDADLPRFNER